MKIFLTGRDFVNWATDDDFRFAKKSLEAFVEITENISEADIIHSINWHTLLELDKTVLKRKIVISHIPHDVRNMLSQPEYLKVAPFVDHWIVPTTKAKHYADKLGLNSWLVPYGIDTEIFYPINKKESLREKYNLPKDKYLIGSFQRDTEGRDLKTPKYIKGPDIFLEIAKNVYEKNKTIHIILAGPRRFWLKNKLKEIGIPFTFVGEEIKDRDDLKENTLNHQLINELYNAIDLYVISSRLEGGPKAILECAATKTKIISTDVGQANDILEKEQIYENFLDATEIIANDISDKKLNEYATINYAKIESHNFANVTEKLKEIYGHIEDNNKKTKNGFKIIKKKKAKSIFAKILNSLFKKRITIYFKFHKGPWGGGNQFLKALSAELKRKGWFVGNRFDLSAPVFLFNSFLIDFEKMSQINKSNCLMINRIDGPTFLIRGADKKIDDNIFSLNNKVADISVFQSSWSLFETLNLGYYPVNPVLISNASNPKIFNKTDRIKFSKKRKIRLISSSWSDNPRKGGPVYKWLDENLDWNKYEYTFVGRVSEKLSNIKIIEPVPSDELSKILRNHDIYIAASDNDPCSNAVVEALSCGLPTVYYNRGGHSELVGFGGLPFEKKEEIPQILKKIEENYESYQNLIVANKISNITENYKKCFSLSQF